jgi:hypothetical protein
MDERRWDTDDRGHGVASGDALAPKLEELRFAMRDAGWVTEQPEAYLLPHLEAACAVADTRWVIATWEIDADVMVVEMRWNGPWGSWNRVRADAFSLIGSFAEHSTHVRQRTFDDRIEFEVATGTSADETPFVPHGHLVRLVVRPG